MPMIPKPKHMHTPTTTHAKKHSRLHFVISYCTDGSNKTNIGTTVTKFCIICEQQQNAELEMQCKLVYDAMILLHKKQKQTIWQFACFLGSIYCAHISYFLYAVLRSTHSFKVQLHILPFNCFSLPLPFRRLLFSPLLSHTACNIHIRQLWINFIILLYCFMFENAIVVVVVFVVVFVSVLYSNFSFYVS